MTDLATIRQTHDVFHRAEPIEANDVAMNGMVIRIARFIPKHAPITPFNGYRDDKHYGISILWPERRGCP